MKQSTNTETVKSPDFKLKTEFEALNNALNSFELWGYKIHINRDSKKYVLVDDKGMSLTGEWDYVRLNHFIMGYGKAFKKFNNL